MKKTALYIHIPFCRKKCAYCNFYSIAEKDIRLKNDYCEKLISQFQFFKKNFLNIENQKKISFSSLYIGGGTPSFLPKELLQKIIEAVYKILILPAQTDEKKPETIEFTLEVNPEDVNAENLSFWKSLGINRLSLGVQSLSNKGLEMLGRNTNLKKTLKALNLLSQSPFEVSADLICGWPGQNTKGFKEELYHLLSYNFNHISLYNLTLEENTLYFRQVQNSQKKAPDEKVQAFLYSEEVQNILKAHNFIRYEISNYARNSFHSRHNSHYWLLKDYISFGASSHSLWKQKRYSMPAELQRYLNLRDLFSENEDFSAKKDLALTVFRFTVPIPFIFLEKHLNSKDFQKLKVLLTQFSERGIGKIIKKDYLDTRLLNFTKNIFPAENSQLFFRWENSALLFHDNYIFEIYSLLNPD